MGTCIKIYNKNIIINKVWGFNYLINIHIYISRPESSCIFGTYLFFQWIIIHSIFELLENTDIGVRTINQLISFWPGGKPYADGWMNQIGDTIGALLGWLSSYYLDQIGAENKWYEKHLSN